MVTLLLFLEINSMLSSKGSFAKTLALAFTFTATLFAVLSRLR